MTSPAQQARIAAGAAIVASVGDLMLLYVANAQRSEFGLPEAGRSTLWIGGVLGVVAIPAYALGYLSASRILAPTSARGARAFFLAGATGALLGSFIHGLTALHINAELAAAAPGRDPLASLLGANPLLLAFWALAALCVLAASAIFAWFVGRGLTMAPRRAGMANPALLTIALATLGLPVALLRAFLVPAAPNIAHVIFFIVCWRVLGSPPIRN